MKTYCIYTNAATRTLTKEFSDLETAKKWVNARKSKHGHVIIEVDGYKTKEVYRTHGTKA